LEHEEKQLSALSNQRSAKSQEQMSFSIKEADSIGDSEKNCIENGLSGISQ
jgi:hypothetical protein